MWRRRQVRQVASEWSSLAHSFPTSSSSLAPWRTSSPHQLWYTGSSAVRGAQRGSVGSQRPLSEPTSPPSQTAVQTLSGVELPVSAGELFLLCQRFGFVETFLQTTMWRFWIWLDNDVNQMAIKKNLQFTKVGRWWQGTNKSDKKQSKVTSFSEVRMEEALEKTAISADVTALTNFGDWSYAVTGVSSCYLFLSSIPFPNFGWKRFQELSFCKQKQKKSFCKRLQSQWSRASLL